LAFLRFISAPLPMSTSVSVSRIFITFNIEEFYMKISASVSVQFGHTHSSLSQDKVRWHYAALTASLLVPAVRHNWSYIVHCHPHVVLFLCSGNWATVERYGS
jgi:hypothetical protein